MTPLRKVVLVAVAAILLLPATLLAHDVPRLGGIRIDGSGDDWGDRGFLVAVLTDPEGRIRPANDLDVRFRLGWDRSGLLVLVEVEDDLAREADDIGRLSDGDSVEILVAQGVGSSNRYGLSVAAGADASFGEPRVFLHDYRPEFLRHHGIETEWAATVRDTGYIIEARLPWENVGLDPRAGAELAMQLAVHDADGLSDPEDDIRVAWYPSDRSDRDARHMYAIRLARKTSPAVLLSATRGVDEASCTVTVRGAREVLGREVVLRSADGFEETRGLTLLEGRAGARFERMEPSGDGTWPGVRITFEGATVASFRELPTLQAILERWIEGVGGRAALERVATRTYLGELAVELAYREPPRETATLEVRFDLPDRWERIVDDNGGTHLDVCEGGAGYSETPDGRRRDDRLCESLSAMLLDPHAPLRLRDYFPELTLKGVRFLEGGEAFQVEARAAGQPTQSLYFDAETGLLVQVGRNRKLQDYRPVDGLMVPHRIETSRKGGWEAYEFHSVTHDRLESRARFVTAGPVAR